MTTRSDDSVPISTAATSVPSGDHVTTPASRAAASRLTVATSTSVSITPGVPTSESRSRPSAASKATRSPFGDGNGARPSPSSDRREPSTPCATSRPVTPASPAAGSVQTIVSSSSHRGCPTNPAAGRSELSVTASMSKLSDIGSGLAVGAPVSSEVEYPDTTTPTVESRGIRTARVRAMSRCWTSQPASTSTPRTIERRPPVDHRAPAAGRVR